MNFSFPQNPLSVIIQLPDNCFLPKYQDKVWIKKYIRKNSIKLLESNDLHLVYYGSKADLIVKTLQESPLTEDVTFLSLHVFQKQFQTPSPILPTYVIQREFRRELKKNKHYIITDNTVLRGTYSERFIDFYLNSYLFNSAPENAKSVDIAV
jgi:hypothetical protein